MHSLCLTKLDLSVIKNLQTNYSVLRTLYFLRYEQFLLSFLTQRSIAKLTRLPNTYKYTYTVTEINANNNNCFIEND